MRDARLSIIVPAFDAAATLPRCIAALTASMEPGDEIIVADDGSRDGGIAVLPPELVVRCRSIRSERNVGRGPIRNEAARLAEGDILVFVDADVEVHPDTLQRVRSAFVPHPDRIALIGSYDSWPAAGNLVSQYRNLLHHYTHQTSGTQASHFWTGLGAVRRDVYEALGGFDEGRWARDMEDVEFGHRLVDAGHRIDVVVEIQGTHLKAYTLRSMVRSDLCNRAIPWSRLIIQGHFRGDRFVTSWRRRISAACGVGTVLGVAATMFSRRGRVPLAVSAAGFLVANVSLWRFLVGCRSSGFALACVPLHLVHSVVSALGFGVAVVRPAASGPSTGRSCEPAVLAQPVDVRFHPLDHHSLG